MELTLDANSPPSRHPDGFRVEPADPASFTLDRFGALRHDFDKHPLLQRAQLAEFAKRLMPTRQCRFALPGMTQTSAFNHTPKLPKGTTIEDVFARLDEPGSWLALYNVQTDPAYAGLLGEVITSVQPLLARDGHQVLLMTGFIFISSPPAYTPFHIDRENNFWLQVSGRKIMTVFDRLDREIVPARLVEEFIVHGSLEQVRLQEELRERGHCFEVGPGDGVYFPSTTPHMTETPMVVSGGHPGVSISIGVNFYTNVTRRHARVHQLNRVLRRWGTEPKAPGLQPLRDRIKAPFGHAVGAIRSRWFDYASPPLAF